MLCENPACQMVLSIKTVPITFQETPLPSVVNRSNQIRSSVFLHAEGTAVPLEIRFADGIIAVMGRHDPENTNKRFIDLGAFRAIEKGVSRRHAALTLDDGVLKVSDLGSLNHTYLNGDQLIPNKPREVHDGDVITLGSLVLTVRFS